MRLIYLDTSITASYGNIVHAVPGSAMGTPSLAGTVRTVPRRLR